MPVLGQSITPEDVSEILEAVQARQNNFPDEPEDITFMLVLLNIGERYRSVTCTNGEWNGHKKDIAHRGPEGIPLCPNGHPLYQGTGMTLGWVVNP